MTVDVAPVVSALTDAGVAVGAVGGAVLLVVVGVKCFQYLKLTLDSSGGETNFHWDQRDGESYEDFVTRNEAMDSGELADDRANYGFVVSGKASEGYGVSQEEFDSWDKDRQNQYEIDRLTYELGDDD